MPPTATRKTPKLEVKKPNEKLDDAVVVVEDEDDTEALETEDEELDETDEEDDELSDEEKAKAKAELKEAKKKAAFDKLRELNQQKKAARKVELNERATKVQGKLKKGDIKFSTRASYYGVKCRVEEVEEVRGRVLVTVTCMTTKGGTDLPEERYYTRRFSPEFLQDEPPTEAYVPRRGGQVKVKKVSKAELKRRAQQSKKDAATKSGSADDDETAVIEDESADDIEDDAAEEEEDEEDSDEDDGEEDEDSWA